MVFVYQIEPHYYRQDQLGGDDFSYAGLGDFSLGERAGGCRDRP